MLQGDVGLELGRRVAESLRSALGVRITPEQALIRPSSAGRGADYQCNAAMSLARTVGKTPREVAEALLAGLDAADLVEQAEIAGPGFVNFRLRDDWLGAQATRLLADERVGVPLAERPGRYAVDYGSPNVAKEMHVGHLRSSIIGDAIVRLLEFGGHEVIRRNHLGDWGTPFGMLIEHLVDEGWTTVEADHSIGDLNSFYRAARAKYDADGDFAERARRRVVSLQGGDEPTLALWRELVAESTRHFEQVYAALGVTLARGDNYGESFYNPFLADTVTELADRGLTETSDGAVCVFPPGFANRDGERLPLIVRKGDGGYGYAATDLAGVRYWTRERDVTDLVYVVGAPQKLHFEMVFAAAEQAGWLDGDHRAVHVEFGSILGEDGKIFRTRAGDTIKLADLLREAVDRAAEVVAERTDLDERQRGQVAEAVGIGAVKYADLANDRDKDYVFSWTKMLALEGNTAVYLQYANARILSVLRRAGEQPAEGAPIVLTAQAERALVLKLLQLPGAVASAVADFAPHKLCTYLYETATAFSGFYQQCPILKADTEDSRRSRLALARLTSTVLTLGLSLLGIQAPQRM
ncbi:arginine--tRNA ligase [Solihabitans fulvus]|uniref:Arginine--tRNA ligase n=1 Tax=Solihabitans fulvus TaxID=1892852 RepID=A0A5B2XW16_9PSEU|nr:arginine--tRNA ligase [Solihabitans fulvus]KAA2267190.1 arginine--tRNA ligase [Solihabitans fulvus]